MIFNFLISIFAQKENNFVKGIKETPGVLMNKAYPNDFVIIGRKDMIKNDERMLNIIPLTKESIDEGLFLIHMDSEGHLVLKDREETLRSFVTADTIHLSSDLNVKSNINIKFLSNKNKKAFKIFSNEKCLEANKNTQGIQYIAFNQCSKSENQEWSIIPKDKVLKTLDNDNKYSEVEYQQFSIEETLEDIDRASNVPIRTLI